MLHNRKWKGKCRAVVSWAWLWPLAHTHIWIYTAAICTAANSRTESRQAQCTSRTLFTQCGLPSPSWDHWDCVSWENTGGKSPNIEPETWDSCRLDGVADPCSMNRWGMNHMDMDWKRSEALARISSLFVAVLCLCAALFLKHFFVLNLFLVIWCQHFGLCFFCFSFNFCGVILILVTVITFLSAFLSNFNCYISSLGHFKSLSDWSSSEKKSTFDSYCNC